MTVVVDAPAATVASAIRWLADDTKDLGDGRCRVELRGDVVDRLAWVVSQLALEAPVELEPGDSAELVRAHLAQLAARLAPVIDGA